MEINFDLIVAGCNTRCKHCYVNGGPGPMMPLDDALHCMEKLDEIAACLPQGASFTLDNEPMNHPHLDKILNAASHTKHIVNYHHGMTTGIGLMRRKDKEAVVQSYFENGYRTFGLTVHGVGAHHDEIVRRNGAFETVMQTARFLKSQGAQIEVSLMLNRFFEEDRDDISRVLDDLAPDIVFAAIPIFTPHKNMLNFEPYRATLRTFEALYGHFSHWRQDGDALLKNARQNTISAVKSRFQHGIDLQALFDQEQNELYMTIHADCRLYVGNTGAETQCLGDLRTLDPKETAEIINVLPGNRDYGAYYVAAALPHTDRILRALEQLPQDLVYGDHESVLYRVLTELDIPTALLDR